MDLQHYLWSYIIWFMDLHKSIYGAQQLDFSSSITQIELWVIMIRIIDIINRIMGVHISFIELYNSIIIRNLDNAAMEF